MFSSALFNKAGASLLRSTFDWTEERSFRMNDIGSISKTFLFEKAKFATTNRFNKTIGHTMEKMSPVFGNFMNETIQFNINTTIETIKKRNSDENVNLKY